MAHSHRRTLRPIHITVLEHELETDFFPILVQDYVKLLQPCQCSSRYRYAFTFCQCELAISGLCIFSLITIFLSVMSVGDRFTQNGKQSHLSALWTETLLKVS